MTDAQLRSALHAQQAAVVHFSHHANMRAGGTFPDDLRDAIANKDCWPLSCCVVWPQHSMALPGDIGVLFAPSVASVISVSSGDAGSMIASDGTDMNLGQPLTDESLASTFCVTGAYNEWRVRGANVRGIYIARRHSLQAKKQVRLTVYAKEVVTIATEPIELAEVLDAFPGLPVFTHELTALVQVAR